MLVTGICGLIVVNALEPPQEPPSLPRNGHWTEGDESLGAGAARAFCGHRNLTMLRPRNLPLATASWTVMGAPPPPLQSPPPTWPGGASLGPKSIGYSWRRRKIFCRFYWNCCRFSAPLVRCNPRGGGGRHFMTAPPPPGGESSRHWERGLF